jgi:hypothetical protein
VSAVLSDIRPKTVLDVASNRGWYAQLAASLGAVVVAYDIDEGCVAQLYQDALSAGQPVLPLVMDFLNPSPARGICFGTLASAPQRLHCQFVLALGIVHHLVFKKKLSFAQIVDQLSTFVSEWLLIEFIPHEDRYVREWWTEEYSWYTIENFEQSLLRQFRSITRVPSFPEPRVLVLCQR